MHGGILGRGAISAQEKANGAMENNKGRAPKGAGTKIELRGIGGVLALEGLSKRKLD